MRGAGKRGIGAMARHVRHALRCSLAALVLATLSLAVAATAQEFTALARLDPAASRIESTADGGLSLQLALSQVVPWRIHVLDAPRRLVIEFSELDWRGVDPGALWPGGRVEFAAIRPGWSRMVLHLPAPLALVSAAMSEDAGSHTADLRVTLAPGDAASFAAAAAAANATAAVTAGPDMPSVPAPPPPEGGLPVIAIDPGHGGFDPGAEREGLSEADLMLALARELAEAIDRSGRARAVLTRDGDVFVPLQTRITLARRAGAVALVSLHADALEEDAARGAVLYTLTGAAEDQAAQRQIERHERDDLIAGVDLEGSDDRIAAALLELARHETGPGSERLAQALVAGLRDAGARLNRHPRRSAPLAVLEAADFASVLIETGFLSDDRDRAMLSSSTGRAVLVTGITQALLDWLEQEESLRALQRR